MVMRVKREPKIISCKVCKKEISDTAEVCPHCGARLKTPATIGCLIWIIIAIVIIIIAVNNSN